MSAGQIVVQENGARGKILDAQFITLADQRLQTQAASRGKCDVLGGVDFAVDGAPVEFPGSWSYRGVMLTGLPNMVSVFGYINASWTLRADIVSQWFCRLLNHMRETGAGAVVPALRPGDEDMAPRPWIDGFSAGYMQRAMSRFPRQGDREPWVNSQDYKRERREFAEMDMGESALRYTPVAVEISRAPGGGPAPAGADAGP